MAGYCIMHPRSRSAALRAWPLLCPTLPMASAQRGCKYRALRMSPSWRTWRAMQLGLDPALVKYGMGLLRGTSSCPLSVQTSDGKRCAMLSPQKVTRYGIDRTHARDWLVRCALLAAKCFILWADEFVAIIRMAGVIAIDWLHLASHRLYTSDDRPLLHWLTAKCWTI